MSRVTNLDLPIRRSHPNALERLLVRLDRVSYNEEATEGRPPIYELELGPNYRLEVALVGGLGIGIEALEFTGSSEEPAPGVTIRIGPLLVNVFRSACWVIRCEDEVGHSGAHWRST